MNRKYKNENINRKYKNENIKTKSEIKIKVTSDFQILLNFTAMYT